MAVADNNQIQHCSDEQVRPLSQAARALVLGLDHFRNAGDDIYHGLDGDNGGVGATWTDNRTDGPPHLLVPTDILAFNSFAEDVRAYIKNHGQYPIILKACSHAP